jgi:gliding motility associated protien GldN
MQKGFFRLIINFLMRYAFFILSLLFGTSVLGQNLTGKWLGELPQLNKDIKFKLELDIVQSGKTLSGISTFTTMDNHKVVFALTGSVNGRNIILDEYKAVSCDCENGLYLFCLKKMRGTFSVDSLNTLFAIDGTWTSDKSYNGKEYSASVCTPGQFTIVKPAAMRPLDGYYKKTNIPNATKITPYANQRESDVTFAKRVWREIDVRDKMNRYMASPKQRLIDVLLDAIATRDITAYDATATKGDPNGDEFLTRLTAAQARNRMADSSVVDIFDKNGQKTGSKIVPGELNPDSVVKFRIKEDWFFDKQRGIFEPRIIGIAPLIRVNAGDVKLDYQPAFWIYFPQARPILSSKEAINRSNDATGLSYDDVFMKRLFASYVVKESNDKDQRIRDYATGIDKLSESDRLKKRLMNWELGVWQY